jgi:hypothetical protein
MHVKEGGTTKGYIMRALLVTGYLLGLTACGEPMNCEELTELDATLEIGQGEHRFERLDEGVSMELHYGSQGGQHVYLAAQVGGLHPGTKSLSGHSGDAPIVTFSLWRGGELLNEATVVNQRPVGDGYGAEFVGVPMSIWYEDLSEGQTEFTVRAEAIDSCGNIAEDEQQIWISAS